MTIQEAMQLVLSIKPEAEARHGAVMIEIIYRGPGGVPLVLAAALSERGAWNAAAEALRPGSVVPLRIDGKETT